MEREVTVNQLAGSVEPLNQLMSQPMQAKAAYHLFKIVKQVNAEMEAFDAARRNLIAKYEGKPSEDNTLFEFPEGNQEKLDAEFAAFLEEPIKFSGSLSLADLEGARMTAADIVRLEWLLDEGENDGSQK